MYKDSYTPEYEPGGGGWSLQQLSLGILYKENSDLQNYWTRSNSRLNLCRYVGAYIYLYRQPYTDYIFHYFHDPPKNVTKYYFASMHPVKLMQLQHTAIVTSFNTNPHKKKPYKKLKIKPPKLLKNQWYFQQHFSNTPLIHFVTSAISLTNMYGSDRAENNNCSLWVLNTDFFANPNTQFTRQEQPSYGYHPNRNNYYWGVPIEPHTGNITRKDSVYLGNSMLNEQGRTAGKNTYQTQSSWGNPFFFRYLLQEYRTYITGATEDPLTWMDDKKLNEKVPDNYFRETPNVSKVRYNPFKDKGTGNKIYFVPNFSRAQQTWDPPSDKDIQFENFPLWIMLWGIEGILRQMGKCPNLYEDWVMVIQTQYFSSPQRFFVILSESFVHGQGAYDIDRDQIPPLQYSKWFPKYKYQKEAVHSIIMTAPLVVRPDHTKNFQAVMKYNFLFKWGGNPSPLEPVYDPNSQPITPYPPEQQLSDEIIDPATDIRHFIYPWDIRRDIITPTAAKRITDSSLYDKTLFTDGQEASTSVQLFKKTSEKTTEKEKEKTILFQLQQLQQYNKQLRLRLQRLDIQLQDL